MVTTIDDVVGLMTALLAAQGPPPDAREPGPGLDDETARAVRGRDTAALYRMLMDGFSFQGITDRTALGYIERHGNAEFAVLERSLAEAHVRCPKLDGFDAYRGCRFRKSTPSCSNPTALAACPVPRLPLRKGILNEQAFSLFFLLRDRCGGDLVAFIDQVIAVAAEQPDPVTLGREALIAALTSVTGVSRKLASMMLAVLLAAGEDRPGWAAVGASMVAVDSLVHNFLHRTGTLAAYGAEHRYGERCFSPLGCEAVIRDLVQRLTEGPGREFVPPVSPNQLERAIWRFCAAEEMAVCNGNNIRDTAACELADCPLGSRCSRVALRPPPLEAEAS